MRKTAIFLALLLFGGGVLAAVLLSFDFGKILVELEQLKFWQFLLFMLLSAVNFVLVTWRWQVVLDALGHRVKMWKLALHNLSGYGLSFVTPMARVGGEPVRIFFLREKERIRMRDATSSVLTDKAVELLMMVLFCVVGLAFAVAFDFAPPEMFNVLISVAVGVSAVVGYITYRLFTGKGFFAPLMRIFCVEGWDILKTFEEKIARVEGQVMDFFREDKKALKWALLLSLLTTSGIVFEFWLGAQFFGVELSFTQAFILMAVTGLAYLVPVPAGLGMFESGQVAVALWFGFSPESLLAVAVLIRFRDIIFTLGGFVHLVRQGALGLFSSMNEEEKKCAPMKVKRGKVLEKHEGVIRHGFFGREGGVSEGEFRSLNVRFGIGDREENVRENREIIRGCMGFDRIISVDQVHSDKVYLVTGKEKREIEGADALVTRERGIGLMVQTADCQPLLLYCPKKKVVGVVHAGWKGAIKNIVGKTIKYLEKHLGVKPEDLIGVVGPSVGSCCYEFKGGERKLPKKYQGFLDKEMRLDLLAITEQQWVEAGGLLKNLELMRVCTADNTGEYFSHRGEKGETGRQASVIGLAERRKEPR